MSGRQDGGGGDPPAWERLSTEQVADYEMFSVRRDRARSPRNGEVHTFNVAQSPDGVTVLALTPADELVLVRQFRHPLRQVALETPSGVVDPGESPAAAAVRELREETGYEGGEPEVLGVLELNPSWQTTRVHVVRVGDARPTGEEDPDGGEDLRVTLVPADRLPRRIADGDVRSAVSISAVALLGWSGR